MYIKDSSTMDNGKNLPLLLRVLRLNTAPLRVNLEVGSAKFLWWWEDEVKYWLGVVVLLLLLAPSATSSLLPRSPWYNFLKWPLSAVLLLGWWWRWYWWKLELLLWLFKDVLLIVREEDLLWLLNGYLCT